MQRIPVESSNIISIGYDVNAHILEVEFKNNVVYQYYDVPEEMYYELEAAPSKGKYFSNVILPRFKELGVRVQ